jgi:putative ABC transport system ATP-binding protein
MPDALELEQVSKVYEVGGAEVVALNHIDLFVAQREVVTLLGPSGSGKTTLLSIAGGLLTPSTGRVVVGGQDITSFSARKLTKFRRRYVGFIFQAVNLVPFLTARENLLVVAELTRRDRRKATRRADALLEGLGLSHRVDNLPGQLSGGEKQRVAIGRALMNEPTLVLVDEPTSALDSRMGEQVMELIVSEVKARDAAAVVVTHDQRMTRYGDRILTMGDGRIASIQPRPEWTTHRPDPYAEPEQEPEVYADDEPEAEPWVAGGGAARPGPETYPRPVAGTGTGAGAGLYGGRAGQAAAGWRGFPQPQRPDTGSTGVVGEAGSGARRPVPASRRPDRGAGGAGGAGAVGRAGGAGAAGAGGAAAGSRRPGAGRPGGGRPGAGAAGGAAAAGAGRADTHRPPSHGAR